MKKWISLILTVLCVVNLLAGCRTNEEVQTAPSTALALVIAPTANSQGLNFQSTTLQQLVDDSISGFGNITVIVADGKPEVVQAMDFDIPEQRKRASRQKLELDAQMNSQNLFQCLENQCANDPEVDYLAALRLAVRNLSALDGYDHKSIMVMGSGISTAGDLCFQNNLFLADTETIVEELAMRQEIPDFSGVEEVIWAQMADVAGLQPELSQLQRSKLQEIWEGIITKGGGTLTIDPAAPVPVDTTKEYPPVSVVELMDEEPIQFDDTQFTGDNFQTPFVLSEEKVGFLPDQAVFADAEQAMEILCPIAEYLIKSGESILLAGTTAGDETTAESLQLSANRAEAVQNILVQLGVSSEQLTFIGLGCDNPWHISDAGMDGPLAQSNRKVVLVSTDSETARQILSDVS